MASKYLQAKFRREFREVCEMWTGEDGMLMSLTIMQTPDAEAIIKDHWVFQSSEKFDVAKLKPRFVYRDWLEDDEDWAELRKVWRVGDTPTDFPIYEYELEHPY